MLHLNKLVVFHRSPKYLKCIKFRNYSPLLKEQKGSLIAFGIIFIWNSTTNQN